MKVILKEKIRNVGDLGESVNVKPGFARNFLLPQGKALRATEANLAVFEKQRKELEKVAQEKLDVAQAQADQLNDKVFTIAARTGEGGKLFGSIGARDIAEHVSQSGIAVEKHQVRLPSGVIRETGEYEITLHLHTDVDVVVKVAVIAE